MALQTKSASQRRCSQEEGYALVEQTMQQFEYAEHGLVEVLITAQDAFGVLSRDLLNFVSQKLKIPLSQVYGVATFYDSFVLDSSSEHECQVCAGPACCIAGAGEVIAEIHKRTGPGMNSSQRKYKVKEVPCLGLCDQAPAALIDKKAQVFLRTTDVPALLRGEAQPVCLQISGEPREITAAIGRIQPTDLDAHRSEGAFSALEKALYKMTPEQVIAEVKEARLSGRGGAGFSTGLKWELTRKAASKEKYVVCNFDESEPGTFKDRVLMEESPFQVLEGLTLGGYATGANKGYIFIRGEYAKADAVIERAVDELYAENLLGVDILGSDYSFDVEVRRNSGAYICGEETALFEAIEGKRGNPRLKPPYPTQSGLFGKPTAINNVETLAVIPRLIEHGGEWFCQWGTPNSTGLKLFCLSGHVNQPGVIEAPYGLTIRSLVERFGGGFKGKPQAVLIGGAAGGFLHPDQLDVPLTHEDLNKIGLPIGSGALIVFNQSVNLWHILENLAHFFVHECCGQCAPCRIGTQHIYKILKSINAGHSRTFDLEKAEQIGLTIKKSCICGLGMTAANPFLTYLHNFGPAL